MQSLFHSLNIGTLATWLSVAGFGTVGVVVPEWEPLVQVSVADETEIFDADFTLGEPGPADGGGQASDGSVPQPSEIAPEILPSPPVMAPMAEFAPLPEIPNLPSNAAKPAENLMKSGFAPSQSTSSRNAASSSSRSGASGSVGNLKSGETGTSTGLSESARLAAGRMPAPSYPAECRRKGQSGTVVVEFTVDSSGRVISAYAKSSSPWPLLNHEAVRTVRRWKFPPGGIMKLQRPIVFQLK